MNDQAAQGNALEIVDFSHDEDMMRLVNMLRTMATATDTRTSISAYLQGYVKHLRPTAPEHYHLLTRGLKPGQYQIFLRGIEMLDLPPEELPHPESLPVYSGGFLGELIKTPLPKFVRNIHIKDDPVVGDSLAEFRSTFCFPVYTESGIDEWLFIFFHEAEMQRRDLFEQNMIQTNLLASQNRVIITTNRLREATEYIQREIDQIASIQRALLPEEMPAIHGVSVAASYATFDQAGGDYYDFIPLGHTPAGPDAGAPWAMIIADASGHGPAAAVVIAMLHALLHSHHDIPNDPAAFLEDLNTHLQSKRIGGAFITAWLGIYEPKTHILRFASAGHDAPILMEPGEPAATMHRLTNENGYPLGICDRVECTENSVTLKPGQTLVLYTDGITEARNPRGEMFHIEGIETALRECNGEPDCVTLNVLDALRDHEGNRRPGDDQTIVAFRVDP